MNFLADNFAMLIGIIFMLVILGIDTTLNKKEKTIFYISYALSIINLFADITESCLGLGATYSIWRVFCSATSYSIRPFLVYLFILLGRHPRENKTIKNLLFIPAVLNTLVCFSALFCNITFSYSVDNTFIRGPLSYFPMFTLIFYLLAIVIYEVKVSYGNNFFQIISVLSCVLICIIALIIQLKTGNATVGRIALVYSMMFYYMFMQLNQYRMLSDNEKFKAEHDALTGLLNRLAFNQYIYKHTSSPSSMALIIIDIDSFKSVNDNYGHDVGDLALIKVAKMLKKTFRESDHVFRIGGDEFVIWINNPKESFITRIIPQKITLINNELKNSSGKTPALSISAGVTFASESYNDDIFKKADHALYESKASKECRCVIEK